MKLIVPCNVAITRYYRVYIEVEEDATNEQVVEQAYRKIIEADDQKRELCPDPDMDDIEQEDIRWVEPDWDGSWTEEEDREFKAIFGRMNHND